MIDPEYLPYDPTKDPSAKDEDGKDMTCKSGRECCTCACICPCSNQKE
jgi:hypothetical protein